MLRMLRKLVITRFPLIGSHVKYRVFCVVIHYVVSVKLLFDRTRETRLKKEQAHENSC